MGKDGLSVPLQVSRLRLRKYLWGSPHTNVLTETEREKPVSSVSERPGVPMAMCLTNSAYETA